jgi:hypothetical protein
MENGPAHLLARPHAKNAIDPKQKAILKSTRNTIKTPRDTLLTCTNSPSVSKIVDQAKPASLQHPSFRKKRPKD